MSDILDVMINGWKGGLMALFTVYGAIYFARALRSTPRCRWGCSELPSARVHNENSTHDRSGVV